MTFDIGDRGRRLGSDFDHQHRETLGGSAARRVTSVCDTPRLTGCSVAIQSLVYI
jgi:hypothetical protein